MLDLLAAHGTIAAWLAELAVDARFELARFVQQRAKYTELPALDRFLQSVAVARIKYPKRMENLDAQFSRLKHQSLTLLEGELFDLLTQPNVDVKNQQFREVSDRIVARSARHLHEAADTLFKIDKEFSDQLRNHIDTNGV